MRLEDDPELDLSNKIAAPAMQSCGKGMEAEEQEIGPSVYRAIGSSGIGHWVI
jgi:hypothetical protein